MATLLYALQYAESTVLPRLEEQPKDKENEIDNIVTETQKGVASDTPPKRLSELVMQKAAVEETIAAEKIKSPMFTKVGYKLSFLNFRKIDARSWKIGKNSLTRLKHTIYLYADCIKIIYNGKEQEEIFLCPSWTVRAFFNTVSHLITAWH